MLSCKELAQQHASAHIDGDLQGHLCWSVRFHLVLCGHCRKFVRQLRVVRNLLQGRADAAVIDEAEVTRLANQLRELHHRHDHQVK